MKKRNIAIIAHVDHGKTTLVDSLFRQSGIYRSNQNVVERALDSNDLEKERGITILAKCTAINWQGEQINIIDTPGHADFGGEVERILDMVDSVLLLVDAAEGCMPQTRFVLEKALQLRLKPIVVINKIDKKDQRAEEVLDEIFDLFVNLGADNDFLDFPVLYASGRDGWAVNDMNDDKTDLQPLFEAIIANTRAAQGDISKPFAMVAAISMADDFLGKILSGRVHQGKIKVGDTIQVLREGTGKIEEVRVTKLLGFSGLSRIPIENAEAGDIICIAGVKEATVADTLCAKEVSEPLKAPSIEPPTISINIGINDSPLAGLEGKKMTGRVIRDRLFKEAEINVALKVYETENENKFEVAGRGELQLGVLIETMRREGFELTVSRPEVLLKTDDNGETLEPYEEIQIDVDDEFSGDVIDAMNKRKGLLLEIKPLGEIRQRLLFKISSRGMIGYSSQLMTDTKGSAVLARRFLGYDKWCGDIAGRKSGVLIANGNGEAVAYALFGLEERGRLMVKPKDKVYQGMIVGEHSRDNDLEVNALKAKQLTNFRASGNDENIKLTPPFILSLEEALSWINKDECIEVTPSTIRLRKVFLDPNVRKKQGKAKD